MFKENKGVLFMEKLYACSLLEFDSSWRFIYMFENLQRMVKFLVYFMLLLAYVAMWHTKSKIVLPKCFILIFVSAFITYRKE